MNVFHSIAQNKTAFKGQYHKGKFERMISFNEIKKNEYLSVFLVIGASSYGGDLCKGFGCVTPRPQVGGGFLYRTGYLGKRLNLRLEGNYFRLYAEDYNEERNLNFRSTNWEGWFGLQVDAYSYEKLLRRRTLFNPYLFIGVGFIHYDPWGLHIPTDKWHQLRTYETQGYNINRYSLTFPIGFGTKYKLSYKLSLMANFGFRFTLTDNIDDVSNKEYTDPSIYTNSFAAYFSDKSANRDGFATGRERASTGLNDTYFMFNVGAIYHLTNKHQTKVRGRTHLLRK
jgi:hypothetical protein